MRIHKFLSHTLIQMSINTIIENQKSIQYGESGHQEYGWSNRIEENIVQFYFQLTRTEDPRILRELEDRLTYLLTYLFHSLQNPEKSNERESMKAYLSYLYRLIGHTRDIKEGKGEYHLTYLLIYTWYKFHPTLALFALQTLVQPQTKILNNQSKEEPPYGSWKDMKYFYRFCKERGIPEEDPLVKTVVRLINDQLKKDYTTFLNYTKSKQNLPPTNISLSLVAKWIPREKSNKWGDLYKLLATDYFKNFIDTAKKYDQANPNAYSREIKAILKCKREYRKILSTLNKQLDTVQIKQCAREWKDIDFQKVTSITLNKNQDAFLNIKKNGDIRIWEDDRIECADQFLTFIQTSLNEEKGIKGTQLGMNDFTKRAIDLIQQSQNQNQTYNPEKWQNKVNLLNEQWRNHSNQTEPLKKMIPLIDISHSMEGDSLYTAIALGIRVSEKSVLPNRVLLFGASSHWLNLEKEETFINKVQQILEVEGGGTNANFYKALDTIIESMVETKMSPEEIKDMTLVILSDMQIDAEDGFQNTQKILYENIREKFEKAEKKPLPVPHLLFWNLRSTNGFPNVFNEGHTTMVSGYNTNILNDFYKENHKSSLHSSTPWSQVTKILDKERYQVLEVFFTSFLI